MISHTNFLSLIQFEYKDKYMEEIFVCNIVVWSLSNFVRTEVKIIRSL